ncbi:hypothetical protein J4E86_003797 [Alternaria arbusti]|uniref:uncharacterized protein n=1 Tax=Alternaria arbusti TaxID=232088 RepID=UPI00222021BC|nr:uncharacterized protein J4E86_003797 [Alternaria arbusti]KAI4958200.1 hypothetical protein J4E86_003797 [Alternaria arbusti]
MHNATIDEELANNRWYALKQEEIKVLVEELCDKLTSAMQKYSSVDQRFQDLIDAAEIARKLPDIRYYSVAVLGEQGIGKSSLINALFERGLLDRSGSSKACTAYATVLEYKPGATDHTTLSDLLVVFFNKEEIKDCIKEQMDRWVEVYPGVDKNRQPLQGEDENDPDDDNATQPPSKTTSKTMSRAITTAKEFFEIIFNVQKDKQASVELERMLYHTNIKEGNFFNDCCKRANDRFAQLATDMSERDLHNRTAHFKNIPDNRLGRKTARIKELWPFVKVVTIATGHILLRHGLRLFDLPGYGDTSQLREGVINNFRWKADFEMVVAPCSRLQTSVLHDEYIDRSIHLKGANKTILVMNKADELINEDNMGTQIRQINEHPFPALNARLEEIDNLDDEGIAEPEVVSDMLDELLREATIAYIKYETANVQRQMHPKGIKVFSVSALAHTSSRSRIQRDTPILDDTTAGIYALRHFLATLPAATNYRDFYEHVHATLPSFRRQAERPLEKHIEDKSYAKMRRDLKAQIEPVRNTLKNLAGSPLQSLVGKPWSQNEEQSIISGIQQLVQNSWVHPLIYYPGFAKMLAENGKPVSGKYKGYNMNYELLGTMKFFLDNWYNNLNASTVEFAMSLYRVLQKLLQATRSAITQSSAHPDLKLRATEELALVERRVQAAYDMLLASLRVSLGETHLRFTTEIDIYCPIATAMKASYDLASDRNMVGAGPGIYNRQRQALQNSIIGNPTYGNYGYGPPGEALRPLLKNIEEKLQTQQRDAWKTDCDAFVTSAVDLIEGFSNTAEQLLMNSSYVTEEHKQARGELRKLLNDFDMSLEDVQSRFIGGEEEHTEKKIKREQTEDEALVAPSARDPLVPSVPISQNEGWTQFREWFGGGRPGQ